MKWGIKSIAACTFVFAALFAGMLLKGCGNKDIAPDGSTIEISPAEVDYTAADGNVVQIITVTVRDSRRAPLNGIVVTISGGFAVPFEPHLYQFSRGINGRDPVGSPFTGKTNGNGVYEFTIVIPANTVWKVANPVMAPLTRSSGGFLAAGTYSYMVSAVDGFGETMVSQPGTITVNDNDVVNVNWLAVRGATGYNIYGRTAGSEELIGRVASGTVTTWPDNGLDVPAGPLPGANTTAGVLLSPNSFTDSISVSSGTAFGQVEVKFNAATTTP